MGTGTSNLMTVRPAGVASLGPGVLALLALLAPGCASSRPQVAKALREDAGRPARVAGVGGQYHVRCPDVLEVRIAGRDDGPARVAIGPDGRVALAALEPVRVEGLTTEGVARAVAEAGGVDAADVAVRVADYRSQHVYLFGEVNSLPRAVPYQGPETVLDLLQRVGGITPGAKPDDVCVIRAHITEGRSPEVFRIDLGAILMGHDDSTNLRLQPFDQIHVGRTRQAQVANCMPPWVRQFAASLRGGPPPEGRPAPPAAPP